MTLALRPRRVPLLWLLLPYAAGLVFARFLFADTSWLIPFAVAAGGLGIALWTSQTRDAAWRISISIALISLGVLRYQAANPQHAPLGDFPPREVEVELKIERLFDAQDSDRASGLARIVETPLHLGRFESRLVHFSLERTRDANPPVIGEIHAARGLVATLPPPELQNGFERYLANQSATLTLRRGLLFERQTRAPAWRYWQEAARQRFRTILINNKRPDSDWTHAYLALLTGRKSELSAEQKDLFLQNGAMHLFAISGLHIGVIAACAHALLLLFRVPRRLLPWLALAALLAFVLVTGGSASSWRAFLMVSALYLCHGTRRQVSPLSALALAACVYLLAMPNELFQAGFQMSYLTVVCILLFGLPLARNLNARLDPFAQIPQSARSRAQRMITIGREWLLSGFAVSLAATLCASLLGALYFQMIPVYGVFVNLVAIPLASLALVAGCGSLVAGLLFLHPVSYLFNNAALLLIAMVEHLLQGASRLPMASIPAEHVSEIAIWMGLGASFVWIAWTYGRGERSTLRWQLPPLAFCLLALAWG